MVSTPKPQRRTQAERSAETRLLLIEATIDCLFERGYMATSTTAVADRAGVTRGAQIHHFPRKLDLMEAAILHLAKQTAAELSALTAGVDADADPRDAVLDLLWKSYQGRFFWAYLEFVIAARTDPSLHPTLRRLDREAEKTVIGVCATLLGSEAKGNRKLQEVITLSLRFMAGLVVVGTLRDASWRDRSLEKWKAIVRPLIDASIGT